MSGYLTNLISSNKGQKTNKNLRPIIRSQSPIAEFDQRIGLSEFDQVPFAGVRPNTENQVGNSNPDISSASPLSNKMIQRKSSVSYAGKADVASNPAFDSKLSADKQAPNFQSNKLSDQGRGLTSNLEYQSASSKQSENKSKRKLAQVNNLKPTPSLLDDVEKMDDVEKSSPSKQSELVQAADQQVAGSDSKSIKQIPEVLENPNAQQINHSKVVNQYINSVKAENSSAFVPLERHYPEHSHNLFSRSKKLKNASNTTPKVIIDRLNIEVIQPQPISSVKNTENKQPQTAASASVIGPLSTGINSNLRLSLRHR